MKLIQWKCEKCNYQWGNAALYSHAHCKSRTCNWPWHTTIEVK